jgi:transposase
MFIKTIVKTDKNTGKRYEYYRLCEGYRIADKVRHRSILTLGKLEGVETKEDKKLLADRVESLIKGDVPLFGYSPSPIIEQYAQAAYKRIRDEKLLDLNPMTKQASKKAETDYRKVDVNSIVHEEVRELGSEWLCKQSADKLELHGFLTGQCGFDDVQASTAIMHIVSRAVYPASEHKTAQWIKESSSVAELCNIPEHKVNRYKLYAISRKLYARKTALEKHFSQTTNELFDLQDKIIFYDLTNTYFEGRKQGSRIARFGGVSKEKRSDAKIVALATVINAEGFIKYSKIYQGNITDVETLETTVNELSTQTSLANRKPVVVMDAGFASDDNLKMLKQRGYSYICVSRMRLKDYQRVNTEGDKTVIYDKRDNPIELDIVKAPGVDDTFLYVRSQQKAVKEASMNEHFSQRYEQDLERIREGIHKKGGTKKLDKVWERVGRLKERYPTANKHYNITIVPDGEKVNAIDLKWSKKTPRTRSNEGVYFVQTNLDESQETTLWTIYNTLTEIEATFRVLKTDLSLRPVFHQKDENTEAHLFLGLLAYQLVSFIRYQLKQHNINHDWRNIVRIMNTQKMVTSSMKTKSSNLIRIKKSSLPKVKVREIYDALDFKYQPFTMKKSVVPET